MLLENNWIVCNKILEVLTIFNDGAYTLSVNKIVSSQFYEPITTPKI